MSTNPPPTGTILSTLQGIPIFMGKVKIRGDLQAPSIDDNSGVIATTGDVTATEIRGDLQAPSIDDHSGVMATTGDVTATADPVSTGLSPHVIQWEYMIVNVHDKRRPHSGFRTVILGSDKSYQQPKWTISFEKWLNQLGREGWEVTAASGSGSRGESFHEYILKRQKKSDDK